MCKLCCCLQQYLTLDECSVCCADGHNVSEEEFMKLYGSKANKPVPAITPSSKKEQAKLETLLKLQNAKRIIKHLEELDEEDLDYEYISDDSQDGTIQLDDLEELDANELEDLQADLEPVKKKRKKKTVHANSQPNVSQD